MKRKLSLTLSAAALLSAVCTGPAFAGSWEMQEDYNRKYRMDDGSFAVSGWQWIDTDQDGISECYYFGDNGNLYTDCVTPDGYFVNDDGAWIEDGQVQILLSDYTPLYQKILDNTWHLICHASEAEDTHEGETGILEAAKFVSTDEALASIGYAVLDISGDGQPELIIGGLQPESNGCRDIFAVYTLVSGSPVLSFEGWSRNSRALLDNDQILSIGSNGAMYSIISIDDLTKDGSALTCVDYYFSYEKDDTFTEVGYYHNTTGDFDKAVSEELHITSEAFWTMEEEYEHRIRILPMQSFTAYQPADRPDTP